MTLFASQTPQEAPDRTIQIQHNTPNWILVAVREEPRMPNESTAEWLAWWLRFTQDDRFANQDKAEQDHARRVLTKLAALT